MIYYIAIIKLLFVHVILYNHIIKLLFCTIGFLWIQIAAEAGSKYFSQKFLFVFKSILDILRSF